MYVVVGSASTAERIKKVIERTIGFPAAVVHTPAPIRSGGCSYSVRCDDRAMNTVKKAVCSYGLSYKKIYIVKMKNGERVYHAVS